MNKIKNKEIYLEALRVISIIFIIFNHTKLNGFFYFSLKSPNTLSFWIFSLLSIFCKFGAPMFFMISGSLLLKKEENLKTILKKRILKILLALLLFSFLFYLLEVYLTNSNFNILIFIKKFFTCKIATPFWYLYMYTAFLISLPFLRQMVKNLNNLYYKYMIVLSIVITGIIPCLYYLIFKEQISMNYMISPFWLINTIVLFPCIGYYIDNKLSINKIKSKLLSLNTINIISLLITAYMTYYSYKVTGILSEKNSQIFYECFVLLNTISIFLSIKYLLRKTTKLDKIFLNLGQFSFGIYIIHLFINEIIYYKIIMKSAHSYNIFNGIILCFTLYTISLFITFLLSKIPKIKKLIGF